ncbi:hypothetical protein [Aeromonas rivipollensis]|uniref:hypothetical protein n=1 Tax=Aeromonas rivipollensis TaxID=948519 RepID=UPI0038D0EE15
MTDVFFIDTLSERGHVNFNKNFVRLIKDADITSKKKIGIFCSDEHEISDVPKFTYSSKFNSKRFHILYRLFQIVLLLRSFWLVFKVDSRVVVFLSYEIFTFSILSHIIALLNPNRKIYILEHNTYVPSSKIKKFLFLFINKRIKHICLAKYIEEELISVGRKAVFISHPFYLDKSDLNAINIDEYIAFMPSSNIDGELTKNICRHFKSTNHFFNFYLKSNLDFSDGNIFGRVFFDRYAEYIITSKVIFIPQKFIFRVSGVFFEAIANSNAVIVMSKCPFSIAMKKTFGSNILFLDDIFSNTISIEYVFSHKPDIQLRKRMVNELTNDSIDTVAREFYEKN